MSMIDARVMLVQHTLHLPRLEESSVLSPLPQQKRSYSSSPRTPTSLADRYLEASFFPQHLFLRQVLESQSLQKPLRFVAGP